MSVFRELIRSAIDADLGKNDFKVFIVLLEQTLGYGKETDRLTDRRLAGLCNMRLDRFRSAAQTVVNTGLFDQRPAKMFQYRYTIGEQFLAKHIEKHGKQDFFTPALPKKRADFQKTEEISEKQRHTSLDLDLSLSSLLQPLQTLLSFSTETLQQQMQQQAQFINTLLQAQQNPSTANPPSNHYNSNTCKQPPTPSASPTPVVNINTAVNPTSICINLSEAQLKHHNSSEAQQTPVLKTEQKPKVAQKTEVKPDIKRKTTQKQSVTSRSGQCDNNKKSVAAPLDLPKATAKLIPTTDHAECKTLLATLSTRQQKNTFLVYEDMLQQDRINFPMPFFRTLVEKAQHDALRIPKRIAEANKPTHPSMIIESNETRLARQDEEDNKHDEQLCRTLRKEAAALGISVTYLAKQRLLDYLFPLLNKGVGM